MTPLQLEIQLKNYSECPDDKKLSALQQTLASLPLSTLNEYCLQSETIRALLGQAAFLPFWQNKMAGIKVKGLPDFRFEATQSLNPMEITLGYFNYLQSVRFPEQATKFIHQALAFHSFHALEAFSRELIINKEDSQALLSSGISFFEQEAAWHGTPAYLLVAKLYFKLALDFTYADRAAVSLAYQMALRNLAFAQTLESESEHDLNNAYFGQSLAKNNPFKQPTIEAIRATYIKEAGSYLDLQTTSQIPDSQPQRIKIKALVPDALSEIEQVILKDYTQTLSNGFNQIELDSRNTWGETPLLFAIRHKKIDSVRCLLALGANPTQADSKEVDAFRLALETGQLGIGRLLLLYAPGLITKPYTFQNTENEAKKTLYALKRAPGKNELTTLAQAFQNNDTSTIQTLLEKGLSPNLILPSGQTGLAQLFAAGNKEGIELLLHHGVSLSQQNTQGETILFSLTKALHQQANAKHYFHHFIVLGADINTQNKMGETPLIQAVKRRDIQAVSFLLQQDDIDLAKKTNEGLSALDYAKKLQYPALTTLLDEQSTKNIQEQKPEGLNVANKVMSFFGRGANYPPTPPPGQPKPPQATFR